LVLAAAGLAGVNVGARERIGRVDWQRRSLACAMACLLADRVLADEGPADIHIVADQWHDLTRSDGSGLYFELIRAVYSRCGITVYTATYPYARGVYMVQQGRADAWVGSFWHERDFPVYPKWPFERNRQMVLARRASAYPYQGVESLRGRRVAWLRGFNMDRYIAQPMRITEVDAVHSGIRMIEADRIDFFICAEQALRDELRAVATQSPALRMDHLMDLGLYLAFSPSHRGRRLSEAWDRGMASLQGSQSLRAIFQRAGYPYPF